MTQYFLSGVEVHLGLSAVLRVTVATLVASYASNRGRYLLEIKILLKGHILIRLCDAC